MDLGLLWKAFKIGLRETLFGKPQPKKRRRVKRVVRQGRGYYPAYGYYDEEELFAGLEAEWGDPTEPIDDFLADMNGGSL